MSRYPLPGNDSDQSAGLRPPQFGLKAILVTTALAALILTSWRLQGPIVAASEVLLLLAIFAHVAGNSLGTKLREQTRLQGQANATTQDRLHPIAFAPKTDLALKQRLGWMLPLISCVGGTAGGGIGGNWLIRLNADQIGLGSSILAYTSCAILGGFAGFVAYSFAKVTYQAVSQAHRDGK